MGQIAGLASSSGSDEKTQFQKEVDSFIKIISFVAITIGACPPAGPPPSPSYPASLACFRLLGSEGTNLARRHPSLQA